MASLYNIMQKILRLVDTIGAEKTLSHLNEIDTEISDVRKLEAVIFRMYRITIKDIQQNDTRSKERHLALLTYIRFAKEEIRLNNVAIAHTLSKTVRTITRYIATYTDYADGNIAIAKEFNINYEKVKNSIKDN